MPTPEPTTQNKIYRRFVSQQDAVNAFNRLTPVRNGRNYLIRFNINARIEHLVLMGVFSMMALTGLAQTFDNTRIGSLLLFILGGVSGAQKIHHVFAIMLGAFSLYHVLRVLDGYFIHRQQGSILPDVGDVSNFVQMLKLAFGFTRKVPLSGRYSLDQKFLYWITFLAVSLAGVTGIVMWFPTWVTQFVPGSVYPFAVLLHRWQAILVVVVVVLLHGYQVLFSRRDFSIFSGRLSVDDMLREHPVELAYLEQASGLYGTESFPQVIKFSIEESLIKKVVTLTEENLEKTEVKEPEVKKDDFPVAEPAPATPENTNENISEPEPVNNITANGEISK